MIPYLEARYLGFQTYEIIDTKTNDVVDHGPYSFDEVSEVITKMENEIHREAIAFQKERGYP